MSVSWYEKVLYICIDFVGLVAQVPHRLCDGARSAFAAGLVLTCNQPAFPPFRLASRWRLHIHQKIKEKETFQQTKIATHATHWGQLRIEVSPWETAPPATLIKKQSKKHIKCFSIFFWLLHLVVSEHHHQISFSFLFFSFQIFDYGASGGASRIPNTSKGTALSD